MAQMLQYHPHKLYLTDGGLETTLIYRNGYELPCFAAFDLVKSTDGYETLRKYYESYLDIARKYRTSFILESATWRASRDWLMRLGYPQSAVYDVNKRSVQMIIELRKEYMPDLQDILISGCIGPRGDGYNVEHLMSANNAADYHYEQAEALARSGVDMITAITMNYVEEAEGIVAAANSLKIPVIISFTVETHGALPTGMSLKESIEQVDRMAAVPPAYYMINCAHPAHFEEELNRGVREDWTQRIRGIRANASCKSHFELDNSTELDRGNPGELGIAYQHLKETFSQLNVFGGCCGTDEEHIHEIAKRVASFY